MKNGGNKSSVGEANTSLCHKVYDMVVVLDFQSPPKHSTFLTT
jgi:hypothetical protein